MSGKIKTGDSTWSSASDMYVKTGPSTWNRARTAYVKTDASTWSLWFRAAISDAFNRSTSGSLGNADTGQTWSATSGTWYANGSQAQSDTAASSYPIASVDFGTTDVTVSATVSPGTGPAIWVNSSGDWIAAIAYQTQVNGTYSCNCSCNNCSSCGYATVYDYGWVANPTYTSTDNTTIVYTRVSGATYHAPTSAQTYCYITGYYQSASNTTCYYNSYAYTGTYVAGQPSYLSCDSGGAIYPDKTCCTCYNTSTNTTSQCTGSNGGGGTTCGGGSTYQVIGSHQEYQCSGYSGGTYPSCSCGSSCQTCGTLVNAYYLRLIQSVNGTVTTIGTDISLSSAATAIKITTAGDTITYQAYSDVALTSPLGSQGSYTPTTPTKATSHGIIKAPSSYAQGSTVDDFRISG